MTGAAANPPQLDPLIHEASRLQIVSILAECQVADFNFLLATTGLTRGNLSSHMARLVAAGYADEKKEFVGRMPHTEYRLNRAGRRAFKAYRAAWRCVTSARPR
jgi:DNA-binding transcriptional ArsR family regulator